MSTIDHHDLVVFAIRKAMMVGVLEIEIERLNGRVNELLEANNRLVEERRLVETDLAKLKAEASTEVPPAEEPHEHWLGLDEYGRVHKTVEGAWSVIGMELISWLAQGLRPIRRVEQSHG